MEHLKIEYLPISDLKPYENNAKIHTEEQIEQIEKSIKEYGMCDPIGVWHDEIVEGHGRLLALKNMGETIAPFVRLDHLTDEERREYMLVHNQLTMNTGFDEELLREELETIDADLSEFGLDFEIEQTPNEPKEVEYKENISVVIDCENETEAETIFNKLVGEGYSCRISTL